MTDEEFIVKAKDILDRHGSQFSQVCADKVTLYLGDYGYMNRSQMVGAAKEILTLEGYTLVQEIRPPSV